MNSDLTTLFDDAMKLCAENDAFYFVDQKMGDTEYRIFTYRLASFSDFQNRNALEMRGHTFRKDADGWKLASLPPQKPLTFEDPHHRQLFLYSFARQKNDVKCFSLKR